MIKRTRGVVGAVTIAIVVIVSVLWLNTVSAETLSWANAVPKTISKQDVVGGWHEKCRANFQAPEMAIPVAVSGDSNKTNCLLGEHNGVRVLIWGYSNLAVQFPGDRLAYPVGVDCASCLYLPSKDTFINIEHNNNDYRAGRVVILKNFLTRLKLVDSAVQTNKYYSLDQSSPDNMISNFSGKPGYIGLARNMQRSQNDKWLVVDIKGTGIVRVNLDTMQLLKFSNWRTDIEPIEFDITNDGQHIAVFGLGSVNAIYDIVSGCGNIMPTDATEDDLGRDQQTPCPELNVRQPFGLAANNNFMPRLRDAYVPQFSEDGGEITFAATSYDEIPARKITLRAANYTPSPYLDYLALGDSYSSGEGDTELRPTPRFNPAPYALNPLNPIDDANRQYAKMVKYYRDWTDNEENKNAGFPREKCHVSTRSYPYLLAAQMALPSKKWNSVTCSGATMWDVKKQGSNDYLGQRKGFASLLTHNNDERLTGYNNANELKSTALNELIPGRQKQIEFVGKYKPMTVTLTIGGNDAGFGGKVLGCLWNPLTTCETAKEQNKANLALELKSQFEKLYSLYNELKIKSPLTKFYVTGYPQVINPNENANCTGSSIGGLNSLERKVIYEGYAYMNKIIKTAAEYSGVKYIDIENSLTGNRLCDSNEKYITGVAFNGQSEFQETFHPNAKGHKRIADAIKQQLAPYNLLTYPYSQSSNRSLSAPTPEGYLANGEGGTKSVSSMELVRGAVPKGQEIPLKTGKYVLKQGSQVEKTLFSDPVALGISTVASDGSLSAQITIPSTVPAGFHTLVVTGESNSGEPVQLEQVIEVQGANPNDRDEDGVDDSKDKCFYMAPANTDIDADGIDDACDPTISTPQLYRVRHGDPKRGYANNPEKEHYIYVERNVKAASLTGVIGDHDPDGDGWAIVAASQGKQYTASSTPDTGPVANFQIIGDGTSINPYKPIVSIRAGGYGCVQYRPASLSKVAASQSRTFSGAILYTNTCRQQSSSEDVDGNGVTDNTQKLYMAKNGELGKGEDPNRLYVFRNFYANESQEGVSDYSPTGTAANTIAALPLVADIVAAPNHPMLGKSTIPITEWNLLATSPGENSPLIFNKLVILSGMQNKPLPVVFAKDSNNQCVAYKPESTGTIQFVTQAQRKLIKLNTLPQGATCE